MIRFRAYADQKQNHWIEVRVFDTAKEMRRDISRCTGEPIKYLSDVEGQVASATRRNSEGRTDGCFGVMFLNRPILNRHGMEVVAHESVHAALRYFHRRGWVPCLAHESQHNEPDPHERHMEERLAYTVGRIASNINRALFRRRIWT